MAEDAPRVQRTLQLRFTAPSADPAHLLALVKASTPFFEMFGSTHVSLLQNVDDPSKFIQVIEYEAPAALELNRQRIVSDPRLQTYLQTMRAMLPGSVEFDVYKDVGSSK